MIEIKEFEEKYLSGSKRTNLVESDWLPGWFAGYGKDDGCVFEGTWWDMICFARNVLASPNTNMTSRPTTTMSIRDGMSVCTTGTSTAP